jgi:hypothetical protein
MQKHLWMDNGDERTLTDSEFAAFAPGGYYVENPYGGPDKNGSYFVGPFPTVGTALDYWRESGIYTGERVIGKSFTDGTRTTVLAEDPRDPSFIRMVGQDS